MSAPTVTPEIPYRTGDCRHRPGRQHFTVRLRKENITALRDIAAQRETTTSELVRFLIERQIDWLKAETEADEQRRP